MDPCPMFSPRDATTYLNIPPAALANLSQGLEDTASTVEVALAYDAYDLQVGLISVALLTMFLGLFTLLAVIAAYVLFSKGINRKATGIMLVAIIVMWLSTVAHWSVTLVAVAKAFAVVGDLTKQALDQLGEMQDCLYSMTRSEGAYRCSPQDLMSHLGDNEEYNIEVCTGTVALIINVVIGDSIVWWRAWVLWPDSRVVRWVCVIMIFLTTITGAMETSDAVTTRKRTPPGEARG
ncbi:hypothetical protein OH76DRAFT_1489269 [Lentinus brumalis]|uniref:Uncharacterized protein n=1 Tax=Lentinus brumalis TaxID=2498619 RepID=A0A371CN38_9APHY|nr:hypothetical protein OH76DRAFT_1489269 [Polyporus brumalis]